MKKFIQWTNGKKTIAGLIFYFLVGGFTQIGFIDEGLSKQLELVANVLVGAGLIHKVKKSL